LGDYRGLGGMSVKTTREQSGFTIVELLIVIVVIAVLAAIAVVAFNGIQAKAVETSLQSDLRNAATQLGSENTTNGVFPATESAANGGSGLKKSSYTRYQYSYIAGTNAYCLTATATKPGIPAYMVSSDNQAVRKGICPGHIDYASSGSADVQVSTLIGDGIGGAIDGTGSGARIQNPYGIVVDSSGTLYTTETASARIRRVTPTGTATTIAGGSAGYVEGNGTAARFSSPTGIARAANGNLYVSDRGNHRIRRIDTSYNVTTFAGTGVAGYTEGAAASAQFNLNVANDVVFDSQGNLYASDLNNARIRKITTAGVVSSLTSCSDIWSVCNPTGLSVDSQDNIYVANRAYNRIDKVTPSGTVSRLAGGGADGMTSGYQDGSGDQALFNDLSDIAVDGSGNVYVADYANHRIRKVTSSGQVSTIAGTGVQGFSDGAAHTARFNAPYGIAVDPSGTIVYVADWGNQRIRKITL